MGALRTLVRRLTKLLPDPQGVADGNVVTTKSYVDERGITQYGYDLEPGGGGGGSVESVTGTAPISVDNTDPANPVVEHDLSGVTPGTYGDATHVAVVQYDDTGHAVAASSVAITYPAAYVPPVTTKGDVFGFSTVPDRIPVGTNGQVLTADSGEALGVKWDDPATAGTETPGCIFNNGTLLLSGTLADEIPIPYGGTIIAWTIVGNVAGSASIIVSNATYANYDTMTTLFTATCTSAIKAQATGLSNTLVAGVLRFEGSGFAGFTRCSIVLTVQL